VKRKKNWRRRMGKAEQSKTHIVVKFFSKFQLCQLHASMCQIFKLGYFRVFHVLLFYLCKCGCNCVCLGLQNLHFSADHLPKFMYFNLYIFLNFHKNLDIWLWTLNIICILNLSLFPKKKLFPLQDVLWNGRERKW